MSDNGRALYCWDSTVLLAWLGEEPDKPLANIDLVVSEIDAKTANLLIPVTVYSEILRAHYDDDQKQKLERFLSRSNVLSVDTTVAIATRAGLIRDLGHREKPKRKLKTPDAQIIATAVIHKADALHTFDSDQLAVNGHETVGGFRITHPQPKSGQKGLLGF